MLFMACGGDDPVTQGPDPLPESDGGDGGSSACVSKTCEELQVSCSSVDDGCGTALSCTSGCPTTEAECADQALGTALPVNVTGNNRQDAGGKRRFQGSTCGANELTGDVGYERTFSWAALEAGEFVFDTSGSVANTLIYLRRDSCSGAELACDDNGISPLASKLTATLAAGEKVIIVVDSATLDGQGTFRLHVNRKTATETAAACGDGADNDGDGTVDCLDTDCATAAVCSNLSCADTALPSATPIHLSGATIGKGNQYSLADCSGEKTDAEDFSYRFKAPATGDFVITARQREDSTGTGMIPVLYLLNSCTAKTTVACAKDAGDVFTGIKVLKRRLVVGEELLVVVDSSAESGNFTFHIVPWVADETGALCRDGADNDADNLVDNFDLGCPEDPSFKDPTPL